MIRNFGSPVNRNYRSPILSEFWEPKNSEKWERTFLPFKLVEKFKFYDSIGTPLTYVRSYWPAKLHGHFFHIACQFVKPDNDSVGSHQFQHGLLLVIHAYTGPVTAATHKDPLHVPVGQGGELHDGSFAFLVNEDVADARGV